MSISNRVKRGRGRPKKNTTPQTPEDHWAYAKTLNTHISDHYSMRPEEQELAFYAALSLPKKSRVVELGVTHGKTAALLAYACSLSQSTYTGIDNFSTEGSLEEAMANLQPLRLPITIIKNDTHSPEWGKPVDYVLFDAGHDHFNMRADVDTWLPRLKPGGLALFHEFNPKIDYQDPHFPVKHYANMFTASWEEVAYIPFLMVRRKP